MQSTFRRPPTYTYMDDPDDEDDNRLIVFVKTNATPWENSAKLTHQDGTVYFERTYPEANTQYRDTIYMNQGCYTFEFFDADDDGISFWANNDGSGYVRLRKVGGNFVTFEGDFRQVHRPQLPLRDQPRQRHRGPRGRGGRGAGLPEPGPRLGDLHPRRVGGGIPLVAPRWFRPERSTPGGAGRAMPGSRAAFRWATCPPGSTCWWCSRANTGGPEANRGVLRGVLG